MVIGALVVLVVVLCTCTSLLPLTLASDLTREGKELKSEVTVRMVIWFARRLPLRPPPLVAPGRGRFEPVSTTGAIHCGTLVIGAVVALEEKLETGSRVVAGSRNVDILASGARVAVNLRLISETKNGDGKDKSFLGSLLSPCE